MRAVNGLVICVLALALGAGAMATAHAAAYAEIAEATVVGVFSRDPARARSAAASATDVLPMPACPTTVIKR